MNHERFKYFDDLTTLEIVYLLNIGLSSYNVRQNVPANIPSHNQIIDNSNLKSQEYLDKIQNWTERNLMELNAKKTKTMIFNNSRNYQFTTNLKLKDQSIEVVNEAKLLGTIITSDLKWNRMWIIL